jgi:hypothetical protein
MRRHLQWVVSLVCGWALAFSWSARAVDGAQAGGIVTQLTGRWVSTEYVTFTNPARAGSAFFLDVVIAKDGSFQGTWDEYSCISYPGPYSTVTISCSRVQRPAKARGRFDLTARSGEIELDRLGRSSFGYTLGTELIVELPKDWLKQGDAVLYTSKLARAAK